MTMVRRAVLSPPILIDELLNGAERCADTGVLFGGKWYIARPLPYYGWRNALTRVWHSWLVLTGKASAFQFAQDRYAKDTRGLQ